MQLTNMPKLTEQQHNEGYNLCDKCHTLVHYEDKLPPVWFSEDFTPLKGERVDWKLVKQNDYQMLCEECYLTVLK